MSEHQAEKNREEKLYDTLVAYRDDSSKRLSDQIRALALGTIAFTWVLISDDKGLGKSIAVRHIDWLLLVAALAVLTLAADLIHSSVYRLIVQHKLDAYKDASNADYSTLGYRYLELSPWLRTILCLLACGLLLALVAKSALFELILK
jgi:hypothetical protein